MAWTDWVLVAVLALGFPVILLLQRIYAARVRRQARLADRLWAQVLDDMKKGKLR
jgi:hypothetical protein